jgi:multidrug efflux pump subunit AcrA (membrane-fusion protein)
MTRKIILSILAVALIVGAFFAGRWIIASKEAPKSKPKKEYKVVEVDTVRNKTIPVVIPANGNLVAKNRIELYAEVTGVFRNTGKLFRRGQEYNRGETIISINNTEFYAQVQSARSNLNNLITSAMPDLRLDYPESYPQWQEYLNNLEIDEPLKPLPEPKTEQEKYFITGKNIYSSYYDTQNLEDRLTKFRLRAPYDGVLTEAMVSEGTLVRVGQQLGEFIQKGTYELQVSISAEFVDLLEVGKEVELKTINNRNTYKGEVTRINAKVDQDSQTVTVVIEASHPDLKDGMYLKAILEAQEIDNAIEIGRSLMQKNEQLFAVRDGKLKLIDVQPVHFTDDSVILKGVKDGEVIVSRTVPGAYEGMLVRTEEQAKAAEKENNANQSKEEAKA